MILSNLTGGNESDPAYVHLQTQNNLRHYGFLKSIVETAVAVDRQLLSQTVLKALNFHAIACLHPNAGMYRPCKVRVGKNRDFPRPWELPDLMDDFTNLVNRKWDQTGALHLASFALWRLNAIHPFINGNGRTARAACLFVLCVKAGGWIPLQPILPELIRQNRSEYVDILRELGKSNKKSALTPEAQELETLVQFLVKLIRNK